MNPCEGCGFELEDDQEHLPAECIEHLQQRLSATEDKYNEAEEALEAHRAWMKGMTLRISQRVNGRSPPGGLRVVRGNG